MNYQAAEDFLVSCFIISPTKRGLQIPVVPMLLLIIFLSSKRRQFIHQEMDNVTFDWLIP